MHLLGCLLTFFLILFITAYVFLRNLFFTFFGGSNRFRGQTQNNYGKTYRNEPHTTDNKRSETNRKATKEKVINDNEGEYIDFEEIK